MNKYKKTMPKKINEGTYAELFEALSKAINDTKPHRFVYDTLAERYVFMRFLFHKGTKIQIYSNNMKLFNSDELIRLETEIPGKAHDVYEQFIKAIIEFFVKNGNILELLIDNLPKGWEQNIHIKLRQLFIDKINNKQLIIKHRNQEYDKIAELSHFAVAPFENIVCFYHSDDYLQICSLPDKENSSSASAVFNSFMKIS